MTMSTLSENKLIQSLQNRTHQVLPVVLDLIKKHTPNPDTDPDDLSSYLLLLANQRCHIEIPSYLSRRPSSENEEPHTGIVSGVVSHSELFSFSVRVREDEDTYRTFMVTDFDGSIYTKFRKFEHFISPSLWKSFYSEDYVELKAAVSRITEECQFLDAQKKSMLHAGVQWKDDPTSGASFHKDTITYAETKIKVASHLFDINLPEREGQYTVPEYNEDSLHKVYDERKTLLYSIKPQLQYFIRCIELAKVLHDEQSDDRTWQVVKEKRTVWNVLDLGEGFGIKYRTKEKTETVSTASITEKDVVVG